MVSRGQHLIGKVLGSCLLEKLLGYGGSSAVYLARQYAPEQKVAVKVFLPRPLMNAQMQREFYRRFLREAEVASKLEHPNILPIYAYGEQDGIPYIVMPYMEGGTLAEYLSVHGPLSLQEAHWYLEQIASALDYAHEHGCIHCDIKPANILLDSEEYALLSDFGIARMIQSEEDTHTLEPLAAKGREAVMGTPDYISPEQALGRTLDGRSDVYSLGIVLFHLLANQLPFRADSSIALALLHVHEPPPSLMPIRADITPAIDQVVRRALAKDTAERFQTAQQLCDAFADAIDLSSEVAIPGGRRPARQAVYRLPERRAALNSYVGFTPRLLLIGVVLLLLIGSSFMAYARYFAPPSAGGKPHVPHVQASVAATVQNAAVDTLMNYDAWPTSSTFFYDTQHQNYHVLNDSAKDVALALYSGHLFSDFRLSVTMDEVQAQHSGANYYGVVFRCSADQARYYLFEIGTTAGAQYDFLLRYDGQWKSLADGYPSAPIHGNGQSNTVTIEAHSNTFTFQINGRQVGAPVTVAAKPPMTAGQVGLYVEDQGAEVAFSHLYIQAL